MFSRSGWSVVRSASLAKGGTSKRARHRTSTNFRLKRVVSPLTLQMALVRVTKNVGGITLDQIVKYILSL
jgi:hypothetical protein